MKVLIVDDKSENLYLLESILKGSGYISVSANNGVEALALARKDIPDLIISDILMPVMDGFTLCREFKKDEKLCNVPFIFYTATYSDPKDEEFALSLGADRFILKPQDPEVFVAIVKELLKEVKKKNIRTTEAPSIPDIVILKEYNQTLVRKLEDKMLKLEQSEKEIRKNNILLHKEIEEHKHTEELLRKSEERFKEVSESLHEWIWEVDNNGLYTFVSPILEELLGYKAEEVIGIKYFYDFFDPEIKEDLKQAAIEAFASKVSFKEFINCNIHKDGRKIILSTSGSPILDKENNLIGYRGVDVDITERKLAEEALHNSEENMRYILKHDPNAIAVYDNNLHYIAVSDRYLLDYNVIEKDIIGKHHYEVFPEMPQSWKDVHQRCLAGVIERNEDDSFERPDGSITYNKWECRPWRRVDGEIGGIITYTEVTTERKLVEMKLQESEERFRKLFENAKIGLYRTTPSGNILMANNELVKMLGYPSFEVLASRNVEIGSFGPSYPRKDFIEMIEKNGEVINFESEWIRLDGTAFFVRENAHLIRDANGNVLYYDGVVEDITEIRKTEIVLRESEQSYRTLADSGQALIWTAGTDKLCYYFNKVWLDFTGRTFEQEVGNGWVEGVHPDDCKHCFDVYVNAFDRREKFSMVYRLRRNDGIYRWILDEGCPRYNSKGGFIGYIGHCLDISERQQAEDSLLKSKLQYDNLVSKIPVGIYILHSVADGSFKLDYASPKMAEILDVSVERLLADDQIVIQSIHPEDRDEFANLNQEGIRLLRPFDWKGRVLTTKGVKWLHLVSSPEILENGDVLWNGLVVDITERKLAEEEIIMLAHSLKSINECVSITDMDDKILFVNKAFLNTYGYNENELIGKHISIVRSKKNTQEFVKEILPATKQGEWKGELFNQRKDGSEFPIYLSTSIIYDFDSKPIGLIGVASDITAQKQMVDDLLKLSSAVEQSPTSIIITDLNGNIEYVNPKVTETTGYQFSELLGKNPRIFRSGEKSAYDYKILWGTISAGEEWRGEFHNKKKNGESYWESASISAIKNNRGQVIHYLAVKEDISEKKKIHDELVRAKDKAEEMNHLKTNFLANMSHELRTPLVGILGYSDLISQETESPEIRVMAETILKSGIRLSETLNLILDLSRFETEKKDIKFQKVELVEITKNILNLFSAAVQKKGLSLTTSFSSESILINFDKRAYTSILNNLVNNAVKYTNEGSITINLSLHDHEVELKVTDTGIGIAKNDYESIFDEFRQVSEGYSRNFEGSGLGLSITKKFVEKYGGTITVDSEVGKGSTFKVLLPLKMDGDISKEITASEINSTINSPKPKLLKPLGLLVDDDPLVFQFMTRYLKDYVALETTFNAEIAFKLLKEKKYDLIFMDINLMHGIDGKKAASMIRKMERYAHTPIIATTAYVMAGDKEEFISAGCSHYLPKPFNKKEIIQVVKEALKL